MGRAAKGEGSVVRAGNGWRGYVTIAGKRKYTKVYATKALASAAKRDLLKRRDDGRLVGGPTDTLEAWMRHWLANIAHRKPTGKEFAQWLIDKRVAGSSIGNVKLDALTVEQVESWVGELDISPLSKRRYLEPVKTALNAAVERGRMGYNVADRVKLPKVGKRSVDAMSREDRAAILTATELRRNGARWHIALLHGLRPGEALGLAWTDLEVAEYVDTETGAVVIVGTLTIRNQLLYAKDRGLYLEPTTKTDEGARKIRLPSGLTRMLLEHRKAQLSEIAALPDWQAWEQDGKPIPLMFTKPDGSPIGKRADSNEWRRVLEAAGLSKRTRYTARHTAASLAIVDTGGDAAVVAGMLGHADPAFTYRVYVHPLEERQKMLTEKLDAPYRAPYGASVGEGQ